MISRASKLPFALAAAVAALIASLPPATAQAHDQAQKLAQNQAQNQAQEGDGGVTWSVLPSGPEGPTGRSHFVYSLPPGGELSDYVGISNLDSKPLTVTVYATDGLTTLDGAFSLLPAAEPPRDVGTWITLPDNKYTIPPGKRLDIPFQVKVPANAEPGDHAGGVLASVASQEMDAEGQLVTVDRRVGARMYVRVDGVVQATVQVQAVEVAYDNPVMPFSGGQTTVTYRLHNTGNVRVTGTATVRVSGPLGWRLGTSKAIAVPEVLPGAVVEFTERLDNVFPAGRLNAEVVFAASTVQGEELPAVRRGSAVWALPWMLILATGLIVAVVAVRIWRRHRRRMQDRDVDELEPAAA